jgi:hypothetical protein
LRDAADFWGELGFQRHHRFRPGVRRSVADSGVGRVAESIDDAGRDIRGIQPPAAATPSRRERGDVYYHTLSPTGIRGQREGPILWGETGLS